MNRLFARRKHRKSRGVAVIFTLGILGLLTVMALGFASTALLNRKVAENSSVQTYARNIARNIALPRALFALRKGVPYGKIHSSDTNTDQDFLWKLDTLLDSKRGPVIYYSTSTESGSTAYTTPAKWQYIHAPEKLKASDPKEPIIGRFAYVSFPDHGRMDPSVNLGSIDADKRYGSTEKELSLPIGSTDWNAQLKGKLENSNRWQSFNEIFSFLNIADSGSDDSRSMYQDGIGMNLSPASETFWVDLNKDGKQTRNEMFLRFNMTRDWTSTTVDQLIGEGAEPLTLAYNPDKKASNTFIPWLKYANFSSDSDTNTRMKKQIAANIIQYNRAANDYTVTDKSNTADWLTDPPSYAGIGRHPMLNEIGFLVRARAEVTTQLISETETQKEIKYTPKYYITLDAGAELIYPFGKAESMLPAKISFSGDIEFQLRKFRKDSDAQSKVNSLGTSLIEDGVLNAEMLHGDISNVKADLHTGSITDTTPSGSPNTTWVQVTGEGYADGWLGKEFVLSLDSSDWNTSTAYTKASAFWMGDRGEHGEQRTLEITVRPMQVTTNRTVGEDGDISKAMVKRMTVNWVKFNPKTIVLKYGEGENEKQRDVAIIQQPNPIELSAQQLKAEKVWFAVFEATDPLVNHYSSDWGVPKTKLADWSDSTLASSDYPTLYKSGSETATSHLNSTISGKLPFNLTPSNGTGINGTAIQETATDPAYNPANTTAKRLSTSYIRHGQMKSLWELGFISRAEAFRTLNLAKTKIFEPATSPVPTTIDFLQAGDFADGDANILDQVKFSDTISDDQLYKYGKISLNGRNHNTFEQLFDSNVKWHQSLASANSSDDQFSTASGLNPDSDTVCSNTECKKMTVCANIESCSHTSCLAHLLLERCSILPFFNRSDLLLDPDDANFDKIPGYSSLPSAAQGNLKTAQTNLRNFLLKTSDTTLCKAEKEQYAARFMHLFSTEPVNRVYIIIVAQTIKDIGGVPAFVDWNGDGEYDPSNEGVSLSESAKFLKTGYVRRKLDASGYQRIGIGSDEKVKETITTTTIGTYDYGADKITGEAKLIVEMQKDTLTNKWQITGYRYVE